jgi:hypothetical protein
MEAAAPSPSKGIFDSANQEKRKQVVARIKELYGVVPGSEGFLREYEFEGLA